MKSPEWRRRLRRADLRQFQIFRHGAIIIYTRLPAGGTCYPICTFPTNSELLIGISDAFSVFVYGYPSSCPRAHCTPNKSAPTLRYTRRHGPKIQAMPVGTYRVQSPGFPKIVYYLRLLFPEIVYSQQNKIMTSSSRNSTPFIHCPSL